MKLTRGSENLNAECKICIKQGGFVFEPATLSVYSEDGGSKDGAALQEIIGSSSFVNPVFDVNMENQGGSHPRRRE